MKKIYTESNSGFNTEFNFLFNPQKLTQSYEKYVLTHKITKKELNEILSDLFHISEESIRKHIYNKNSPSTIEQIYEYGDFLEGDRYAFLELRETEDSFYEKAKDILSQSSFVENCVQAVRSNIINVLSEYAASDCFNQKDKIDCDILIYYRKKVDTIENMIKQIYKNHDLVKELLKITDSLRKFVCAYEWPGVPIEWYEINPNLRFYSPSFALMVEDSEAFDLAVENDLLDYYPSFEEIDEYIKYFEKLKLENQKNNYHYNEKDYFQRELINTIVLFFENRIEKLI